MLGLSVIRGTALPVIGAALLLAAPEDALHAEAEQRFVTIQSGGSHAALAVESVLGVRNLAAARAAALPPLLGAAASGVVASIATLDAGLLLFLNLACLVPQAQRRDFTETAGA